MTKERISEFEDRNYMNGNYLNNREEKRLKKKMNRASRSCDTISKSLIFVPSEFQSI